MRRSFKEKYETAKWPLRQGDEEVNKRIKQKNVYLNKLQNISVWKQTFFRRKNKNENKRPRLFQTAVPRPENFFFKFFSEREETNIT